MISNEDFWKPIATVVNSLKLRGSWGIVGNDQISGARFPIWMKLIWLLGVTLLVTNGRPPLQGPISHALERQELLGRKDGNII
ncbi:hypothetical protein KUH03_30720 [Sphingobacterium sp. E70]|uniref:hypothetical protein n=1 Tax=Sphingobacterium sp. E70 TaxID=2853439 RepID=UPI00211C4B59|nr:hypothetical protein [Sphingobacterium sp. E70]ULT23511.1 hypothetical protein KUH03_30720 [Sphingobacterium sp. E70]